MTTEINETCECDLNNEPLFLSRVTIDRLYKLEHPAEAVALYCFYYARAKWKHTNTIYATNQFVTNGVRLSPERVARAKKDLIQLGLIEQLRQWNPETKRIGHPLIKVNFVLWDSSKTKPHAPEYGNDKISRTIMRDTKGNPMHRNSYSIGNPASIGSTEDIKEEALCPTEERSDNMCWIQLATILSKIVRAQRKIVTSGPKIKAWAHEIRKLSTVERTPLADIQAAMKWYANNAYSGQFVPIVECGRTFRDKYTKILAAIERDKRTNPNIQPDDDVDVGTIGRNYKGSELTKDDDSE
jgi:hypothetical protein